MAFIMPIQRTRGLGIQNLDIQQMSSKKLSFKLCNEQGVFGKIYWGANMLKKDSFMNM